MSEPRKKAPPETWVDDDGDEKRDVEAALVPTDSARAVESEERFQQALKEQADD